MNVVDSSGWIEYFQDSHQADFFDAVIVDVHRLIVPSIAIFEVHKRLSKIGDVVVVEKAISLMHDGRVIDLTSDRAIAASKTAQKHKLAMADAIMYSIALEFNATFWTQDVDYEGLPSVRYLPKHATQPL